MRRLALLIACGDYQDTKLRGLKSPVPEAKELERLLADQEVGGFEHVGLLSNPTATEARTAVEKFFSEQSLTKSDLVLIYFSGHGVKHGGQLFLALRDTDTASPKATTLSAEFINQAMMDSAAGKQIVILDCCFSGAFEATMVAKSDDTVHVFDCFRWPDSMKNWRGRAIITSSDSFQYSYERETEDKDRFASHFTSALLEGIETGAAAEEDFKHISIISLFNYVQKQVVNPGQRPKMFHHGDNPSHLVIARVRPPQRERLAAETEVENRLRHTKRSWEAFANRVQAIRNLKKRLKRAATHIPLVILRIAAAIFIVPGTIGGIFVLFKIFNPPPVSPPQHLSTPESVKVEQLREAIDELREKLDTDASTVPSSVQAQLAQLIALFGKLSTNQTPVPKDDLQDIRKGLADIAALLKKSQATGNLRDGDGGKSGDGGGESEDGGKPLNLSTENVEVLLKSLYDILGRTQPTIPSAQPPPKFRNDNAEDGGTVAADTSARASTAAPSAAPAGSASTTEPPSQPGGSLRE